MCVGVRACVRACVFIQNPKRCENGRNLATCSLSCRVIAALSVLNVSNPDDIVAVVEMQVYVMLPDNLTCLFRSKRMFSHFKSLQKIAWIIVTAPRQVTTNNNTSVKSMPTRL